MVYVTGGISGVLIGGVVYMFVAFITRNMTIGIEPLDTIIGLVVPLAIGLMAGAHSFRASVKRKS